MKLTPLFESLDRFRLLEEADLSRELLLVVHYLESFPKRLKAIDGYRAVKGFLTAHVHSKETFSSYRTNVERLLLWTLLVQKKPIFLLTHDDVRCFMNFCITPPTDWVGSVAKARYIRCGDRIALPTDTYIVNPNWRPFQVTIGKHDRKLAKEQGVEPRFAPYEMKQHSIEQAYGVCGRFFDWMAEEGLSSYANPFRGIKAEPRVRAISSGMKEKFFTPQQWDFVVETASANLHH